ncbi:protein-L-isoaspartate O-methyltransferase family protein [Oryzibacter oryziterrae]|uniref:protein-L-isoaspartate O-methyltransferase family protein n=1 Tax=Oryzibacter oryziterrae TaxID=2766474 RepID=UPI001F4167E3|nr:protein-L-isoaspartate O-methyltransferase [Oryzibacter oryziterrae]
MVDFSVLRTKMVDGQVRTNDVTDLRIIDAMLTVAREDFVPEPRKALAYIDRNLPVGESEKSRVLVHPMVFAKLVQAAGVKATDKVLEVGSATGYGAAVLSRLAGSVVALEEDASFASSATKALSGLGTVTVVTGKLATGAADKGPFDVILLNGSVEEFPSALAAQLADGGRLLLVEGKGNSAVAKVYLRTGKDVSGRILFNASVPLLPGFAAEPAFVF